MKSQIHEYLNKYLKMSKPLFILIFILFISMSNFAQQGINYKALIKDANGNALVSTNNISVQFTIYEGAALTNQVYQETHTNASTDANGILISTIGDGNTSDVFSDISWGNDEHWLNVQIDIGDGLVDLGTTQFMAVPYAKHAIIAENVSGLEKITEFHNPQYYTGWRLIGKDPENYGNIGQNSIDLSNSSTGSEFFGAIGHNSIAVGLNTEASGSRSSAFGFGTRAASDSETAIGAFNTYYIPFSVGSLAELDRVFVIGNGISPENKSDALIVLKNGTITAPSFDLSEITDDKALITKEYADENLGGSGLEKITQNGNTGWRILGRDPLNYNDIGDQAVDLSISQLASSTNGASGFASFASGLNTESSGSYSVAMGNNTLATGSNSTVLGAYNVENTNTIFAIGNGSSGLGVPQRKNALTLNTGFGNAVDFIIGNHQINDNSLTSNDDIKFFFSGQYGALRAGKVSNGAGDEWNSDNIGFYSAAFGSGTIASGGQSFATGNSTNASAFTSTALGLGTIASTTSSMAVGAYNIDDADAQFMVGNGVNDNARNSAFVVKKDGVVLAPSFDLSQITDSKSLVTKEYTDLNYLPSTETATGLEQITETNNGIETTGWRLKARNPIYYGTIGDDAVDLSISGASSTENGATGERSFATGFITKAIGESSTVMGAYSEANAKYSTAIGSSNVANGERSTALGFASIATGFASIAIGNNVETQGSSSIAMGYHTDAIGNYSTAMGNNTLASGTTSTAMGTSTEAQGNNSTAMGHESIASGDNSLAIGDNTVASRNNSLALGSWNDEDASAILMVGNGSQTNSKTAFKIIDTGDAVFDGEIRHTSTGTANMIPIAYGTISSTGAILSGTGNFTVNIANAPTFHINVTGSNLDHTNSSASVTPLAGAFRTSSITHSNGALRVYIFNSSGTQVTNTFQFVIYKL